MCLDPSNIRSLVTSGSDSAAQDASLRRGVRPHPHASEPVVSLITWRPQAWERRLSLRVDSCSQRSRCFHVGTSVARDNRLAISVQTHFFDSGSAAAVGRQERWPQRLFVWLAKGGRNGGNTSRAPVARSPCCAEHRTGEATYARGRKCENALELRGKRAPAESPDQAIARGSSSSRCP